MERHGRRWPRVRRVGLSIVALVQRSSCYDVGCRSYDYTEERLRNYGYDGGTEIETAQPPDFDHALCF